MSDSSRYTVTHTTTYDYSVPVGRCYNVAHMLPRDTPRQTCLRSQVSIEPNPAQEAKREDYFGNQAYYFAIQSGHSRLCISTESEVLMHPPARDTAPPAAITCAEAERALRSSRDSATLLAREYLLDSPMIKALPGLADYARPLLVGERPLLEAVRALTSQIHRDFAYVPGATSVATPLQEVLDKRKGVCQDFAHLAIGCLRGLGFAARYVSGYLETVPPPGQVKLVGADATHAWLAVYVPGGGWYEFDPTNGCEAGQQHIVTAWGRDYSDVTPLRGVIFGGGESHRLKVAVTVTRLDHPVSATAQGGVAV